MPAKVEQALGLSWGAPLGETPWNTWMDENLVKLGAVAQISVINKTTTVPPAHVAGNRYIAGAGSSGDWTGKDGQLVFDVDGGWQFYPLRKGWLIHDQSDDSLDIWNGTAFVPVATSADLSGKQDTLVSGTNIKTINGGSILGSGDLVVGSQSGIQFKDEGSNLGTSGTAVSVDFVGNVTATRVGNDITVTVPAETADQDPIQFQDEGSNLGTAGTVTEIDFTGSAVTASRVGNKVTVNVTGGGGGAAFRNTDRTIVVGVDAANLPAAIIEAQTEIYVEGARCLIQVPDTYTLTDVDQVYEPSLLIPWVDFEFESIGSPVPCDLTDFTDNTGVGAGVLLGLPKGSFGTIRGEIDASGAAAQASYTLDVTNATGNVGDAASNTYFKDTGFDQCPAVANLYGQLLIETDCAGAMTLTGVSTNVNVKASNASLTCWGLGNNNSTGVGAQVQGGDVVLHECSETYVGFVPTTFITATGSTIWLSGDSGMAGPTPDSWAGQTYTSVVYLRNSWGSSGNAFTWSRAFDECLTLENNSIFSLGGGTITLAGTPDSFAQIFGGGNIVQNESSIGGVSPVISRYVDPANAALTPNTFGANFVTET